MNVKVEDQATQKIRNAQTQVEKTLNVVPVEHLRGFAKIVFVDQVTEPRISAIQRSTLPALYHPRMGGQMAWGEIATTIVAPKKRFPQNLIGRLTLKSSIAQVVLSLVAQHYYLTLSKGVKKGDLERACRQYVEKHFDLWREKEGGLRVKLLKPFKPQLDRWAKKLAKKYRAEMERNRAQQK
jgi:hypothetical protein